MKTLSNLTSSNYITGVQVNYYHICDRKLWLFSRSIQMEQESDAVKMGTVIHKTSYKRKRKEIEIGGIKIDFLDIRNGIIHEVKKSKAMKESHIWQMKYYLYSLSELGVKVSGMINYPLLKRREMVDLSDEDIIYLDRVLLEIERIVLENDIPEVINKKFCKKCSYYDLCYI